MPRKGKNIDPLRRAQRQGLIHLTAKSQGNYFQRHKSIHSSLEKWSSYLYPGGGIRESAQELVRRQITHAFRCADLHGSAERKRVFYLVNKISTLRKVLYQASGAEQKRVRKEVEKAQAELQKKLGPKAEAFWKALSYD